MTDNLTNPPFAQGDEIYTTALWREQRVIVKTRALSWQKATGGPLTYLLRLQNYTIGRREEWVRASHVHASMEDAVAHVKALDAAAIEAARETIRLTEEHEARLIEDPSLFLRDVPIPDHVLERL